jgi:hypothetical protein
VCSAGAEGKDMEYANYATKRRRKGNGEWGMNK